MIREFKETDYDLLSKWWEARGVFGASLDMLPPSGFVYLDGGEPIAMVFLYITNSSVGFVEWLTTSPNRDLLTARTACDRLEQHLETIAFNFEIKHLLGWVRQGGMEKEAVRNGYHLGDHQVTHIYKEVL